MAAPQPRVVQPATPIPLVYTSQDRIVDLRRALDPADALYAPQQRVNVEALIGMYERGETAPDRELMLIDGKVVSAKEAENPKTFMWRELYVDIRLLIGEGGDGTVMPVNMVNDTGSDVLTMFDTDLPLLGNMSKYVTAGPSIHLTLADGTAQSLPALWVEVRVTEFDGTNPSPWFIERAVLRSQTGEVARLSALPEPCELV